MHAELLREAIEFGAVLKQRAGVSMPLEQLRLLANGTQERRLARSDQPPIANVFMSNRHKRTRLDIALGVYMKRHPSCPRAAILFAIFIVRELAKDNRFATPEFENTLAELGSGSFIRDPVGPRVWSTRYVLSKEANNTAKYDHLVDELIGGELRGVGRGVCRDEAKDRSGFAKVGKGTHGGLVGTRLAELVSVAGKSLDAHEQDDVSAPGDATGNLGCYERAIGDKEEEEAMVVSYEVEYIVPQQRLSTG